MGFYVILLFDHILFSKSQAHSPNMQSLFSFIILWGKFLDPNSG